jgi:hypothetical protein
MEFSEFVEESDTDTGIDVFTQEQIGFLESRLAELTGLLDDTEGFISLSSAQKELIIELRILLGQGTIETDFSPEFPYNPWPEYLREEQRSGRGGYGYGSGYGSGYPITRAQIVRRTTVSTQSGGGYALIDSVISPANQTTETDIIVMKNSSNAGIIDDLSDEGVSINDVKEIPDILTNNTLILADGAGDSEDNVKYDDNNNISSEEKEKVSASDPIIKHSSSTRFKELQESVR